MRKSLNSGSSVMTSVSHENSLNHSIFNNQKNRNTTTYSFVERIEGDD